LKQPHSGSVETSDGLTSREIGYLPQQTVAQRDFPASAFEVALSGRLAARGLLPFYSRRDRDAAESNLARLGVLELRNRCYRELSGGQQRRVLLARALCATKSLLLLDEPVAGLDPVATQELYRLIESVNRDSGLTVVMVSHDIRSAVTYSNRILHLRGTQEYFGSTADYVKSPIGQAFVESGAGTQLQLDRVRSVDSEVTR
jgi:zinc transport system ATP-binding protein